MYAISQSQSLKWNVLMSQARRIPISLVINIIPSYFYIVGQSSWQWDDMSNVAFYYIFWNEKRFISLLQLIQVNGLLVGMSRHSEGSIIFHQKYFLKVCANYRNISLNIITIMVLSHSINQLSKHWLQLISTISTQNSLNEKSSKSTVIFHGVD